MKARIKEKVQNRESRRHYLFFPSIGFPIRQLLVHASDFRRFNFMSGSSHNVIKDLPLGLFPTLELLEYCDLSL